MDYGTLVESWKREKGSSNLQHLDKGFYLELSEYIRIQREELQMLDEKTLRTKLTREESERIKKLFNDLFWIRYRKIFELTFSRKPIFVDLLTSEEEIIHKDLFSALERIKNLEKDILVGHAPKLRATRGGEKPKKTLVRFLQTIPAIVGSNTKVYGPFKMEDIASIPSENAESLIKRGIAVNVEQE